MLNSLESPKEASVARKETQISREINDMSRVLNTTCDLINNLEERLSNVLRLQELQEAEKDEDSQQVVNLADDIRYLKNTVNSNNKRLEDVLHRLEN